MRRPLVHGADGSLCSPWGDSILRSGEPAHRTARGTLLARELGIARRDRGNDPDPPYRGRGDYETTL